MAARRRFATFLLFLAVLTTVAVTPPVAWCQSVEAPRKEALEFFEKKIRPLLVSNCYNCHSANTNSKGGLRVDDRNGLVEGGASGAAVVPGSPEKSLLIQAVSQTHERLKMPPDKKLSAEEVADLTKWIQDGAAWPPVRIPHSLGQSNANYEALRKEHWAWQPLGEALPPPVDNAAWLRDDVDRFVLAKLEARGLSPTGDADALTLIRRVTFDLTGLPPTLEEMDAFVADSSPDALEQVVDRLLASPAFGEKWGRHWLDVARYGESTGSARNLPYPQAWRYRDYVIDVFNNDKPYDRFIREQLAGDLLPSESQAEREALRIATGFLALGVKDVNQRFKVRYIMDNIDEQIDTVSRSVLALTASCARCHDHKFDPIPTTDYYALAGIFHSSDLCAGLRNKMGGGGRDYYDTEMLIYLQPEPTPTPEATEKLQQTKKAIEDARAAREALRTENAASLSEEERKELKATGDQLNKFQNELLALTDPATSGAKLALGVRDAKTLGDTTIRIRGEAEKHGPSVPRGFLSLLQFPDQPQVNTYQSGRLELAQWLTSRNNPLTPRVMVNRIWQHLFQQGLVKSVDNFGLTGDVPSHPELLDHLAARFVRNGWSVKSLVRDLVLSRTYRLGAETIAANDAVDPANRLVWRHSPRRLDAEEIRDATLFAAGALDLARPTGSPVHDFRVIEFSDDSSQAKKIGEAAASSHHRSVYLPLLRGLTPTSLDVFDFAEQGMVTGYRDTTTVPQQALYMLNDPFVRSESIALAERLLAWKSIEYIARIHGAYRLTLGRSATTREVERAVNYLADYEDSTRETYAAATPEPAPVTTSTSEQTQTSDTGQKADPVPNPNRQEPKKSSPPLDPKVAAWSSFCQALLGAAEFRYLK